MAMKFTQPVLPFNKELHGPINTEMNTRSLMRNFFLTLILFFSGLPVYPQNNQKPEEGDFLFLDLDCGALCDAIEAVTEGFEGKDYSHLGIIHRKGDSVFVLEAMGNSVRLSPLGVFLSYTGKPALHARLRSGYKKLIPAAMRYGLSLLGRPYDDAFLPDNGKYYCSELVYEAFQEANQKAAFFRLEPMTFRIPGSADFFPVWEDYYRKLGISVPESVPGCNPGGISRSEKLEILGTFTLQKN